MADGKRMKHSVKDTVFRDMFSKKKYLIQLYNALHPEDKTITQADLEIVTLQSILSFPARTLLPLRWGMNRGD